MQALKNLQQARQMIKRVQEQLAPNIYAFLLFDDRPSHRAIEQFVEKERDWLDNLARSARIILFVYVGKHTARSNRASEFEVKSGEEIKRARIALVHSKETRNPSLELARDLGIGPNQLPCIALLTKRSEERAAVLLPLKVELFDSDSGEIEKVLVDFFSIVQECQNATSPDQLAEQLYNKIIALRHSQQARPILLYARETLLTIIKLPLTLPEVMGKAFAQTFAMETAKRVTGS